MPTAATTLDPETIATAALSLQDGSDDQFESLARDAFLYQQAQNPVYRRYTRGVEWRGLAAVPFLPVAAFKEAEVTTFDPSEAERVFLSSATGSGRQSRHYVRSLALYRCAFEAGFGQTFGAGPFTFVAHLPHYADQAEHSSLVYMVDGLMDRFGDGHGGFFLEDLDVLFRAIDHSTSHQTPFILFGAAFGLLDLVEERSITLPKDALVIETGGMKTFRREISRKALHKRLAAGFGVPPSSIRSEYGMCELLSQCYSDSDGRFSAPPWVRWFVLDPSNPTRLCAEGETGVLALFDLANIYTVCAILTEDRAVSHGDTFEVLGRLTGAELRGCNFLLEPTLAGGPSR